MAKTVLYVPGQTEPFKLSRSKIEEFIRCPRCFVLEVRHGIKKPGGVPFTLNVAVDNQMKKEFDIYRSKGEPHPLVAANGLSLVPFSHPELDTWRNNFKGVTATTPDHRFLITGAVDDIWCDSAGELAVVDYKATGRQNAVVELGVGGFYDGYRRQMEIYQWLLRQNDFQVSDTGYWVYVTATQKQDSFDNSLHFESNLISYEGNATWIEPKLQEIYEALNAHEVPGPTEDCDVCSFFDKRAVFLDEQDDLIWPTCEKCGHRMEKLVYGMTDRPAAPGYADQGCIVSEGSPDAVCRNCNPAEQE